MELNYQKIHLNNLPNYFYIKIIDIHIRRLLFDNAIKRCNGTQISLAKKLKVDRRRLEKWRYGRRYTPVDYFKKICSIAGFKVNFFEKFKIGIKGGKYCRNYLILKLPLKITKEWVWMSQIINTDGHIDPKRKIIEISNKDIGVLNTIRTFCWKLGLRDSLYEIKHDKGILINICNKTLTNIFIEFLGCEVGSKFDKVKISNRILNSPKSVISSAMRGAFDGDGWVCIRSRKIGLVMGSKIYIKQVSKILKEIFDIPNKVYGPRDKKYTCEIPSLRYLEKFEKEINFDNLQRRENLKKIISLLKSSYKKKFHPKCSLYENLRTIKENPYCTSELVADKLNRQRGSMRCILKILRGRELVLFSKKGKEFIYNISPKGVQFVEEFK